MKTKKIWAVVAEDPRDGDTCLVREFGDRGEAKKFAKEQTRKFGIVHHVRIRTTPIHEVY